MIPARHQVLSTSSVAGSLAIGLSAGILVADLNPELLRERR